MVTNKLNGKVYVGSHSWKCDGIDPNYYGSGTAITSAVRKYGKENFQVEVLYYYDTVEECRADEERILTEYNVKDCPYSYNMKNSAIGFTSEDMKGENNPQYGKRGKDSPNYGKHLSEDTKRKMSESAKGRKLSDATRKKLSQANKGKTISDETRQKIARAMTGKTLSDEHRKKISQANNYRKTPLVAIQIATGKIRVFESQNECARQLNLDQSKISKCLLGKRNHTGGYTFKYIEQLESGIYEGITELALEPSKRAPTPVIAIQKDTGRVRMFLSQIECSRVLGIHPGSINKCIKGRRKSAGGYTLKRINRDKRVFKVSPRSKADI